MCVRASVSEKESLDTKLCFQLNNSAPFQQYQGPREGEQKKKAGGRQKEGVKGACGAADQCNNPTSALSRVLVSYLSGHRAQR